MRIIVNVNFWWKTIHWKTRSEETQGGETCIWGLWDPSPTCLWRTRIQHPSLPTTTEWAKGTCSKPPTSCHPKGDGWKSGFGKRRLTAQLASASVMCNEACWAQSEHHAISVISVTQLLSSLLCTSLETQGQWSESQRKLWHWTREGKDSRHFIEVQREDCHVQRSMGERRYASNIYSPNDSRLRSIVYKMGGFFFSILPEKPGIAVTWSRLVIDKANGGKRNGREGVTESQMQDHLSSPSLSNYKVSSYMHQTSSDGYWFKMSYWTHHMEKLKRTKGDNLASEVSPSLPPSPRLKEHSNAAAR